MSEKAFRLDFFIAIAALLVSTLTAATLLYQTHVISDQYAATIWPYLSSGSTADPNGLALTVANDGLGPALIESAQLSIDGVPVPSWGAYFARLMRDPPLRAYFLKVRRLSAAGKLPSYAGITTGSISPGTTIRPGDKLTILHVHLPALPLPAMLRHTLVLDFCYCSLNGSCWTLHNDTRSEKSEQPKSVSRCTTSAAISASFATSPSAHPRRK
ncbi:MAG TPA: hypothetical protein VMG98_02555 [Verrucomicrobiae bacterium]|nr:hypothetical protein [Verrucomicrobiae bacterium]